MYKVYYMLPKQHPVFVAEFEDEKYAQVLVDTGNKLYDDGREFWFEEDDPLTAEEIEELKSEYEYGCRKDDELERILFEREEARAINRSR